MMTLYDDMVNEPVIETGFVECCGPHVSLVEHKYLRGKDAFIFSVEGSEWTILSPRKAGASPYAIGAETALVAKAFADDEMSKSSLKENTEIGVSHCGCGTHFRVKTARDIDQQKKIESESARLSALLEVKRSEEGE
jgi:hypothetical protein